jgi:DNA-directed RNA polymerase beta' subunit
MNIKLFIGLKLVQKFDGDEMNLHMPQDVESESELRNLAAVPYQIISPGNNSPIIGIFQDSMLGCYRFTRENIKFTPRDAMNLLMMFPRVNEVDLLKQMSEKSVTSFDLLTQIIPPFSLNYKTKLFAEGDDVATSNHVLQIKNGKYLRGQMDKGVLGGGTKGLIHRTVNDFGNMSASNFIDDLQNIITEYMKSSSFSVGISDLISDKKTNDEIIKVITSKKTDVKKLIDQTHLGIFENNTGKTNVEEFETQVNNVLNQASSEAGKIGLKSLNKDNRFVIMVNAGSKGSELNISQMISCLGQQNVDGKRIPYGFEQRTLPHYCKFDDSPGARGFVESSYINGLSPQELFFHAMGGRVGLIDTAVKSVTWETPIVIIEHGQAVYTEIGKWIDNQLDNENNRELIQHYTERQMELLNIKEGDVYIPTTDENGIVTWGPVTAITRHDPGNELYEIKTSGGRKVIVTESKSLLIWNSDTQKLKEMPTPEIKVGDCVPVTRELCTPPVLLEKINAENINIELNNENGIFIGLFLSKGVVDNTNGVIRIRTTNKNIQEFISRRDIKNVDLINYLKTITSKEKCLPTESFIAPEEFIIGLLNGYFSGSGSFGKNCIYIESKSKRLIEDISMMCSRIGVFSYTTLRKNLTYKLSIRSQWGKIFSKKVSLINETRQIKLSSVIWMEKQKNFDVYNDIVLDKIEEINIIGIENHPKVYDLTIPTTLNFGLANGLQVRDTSSTGYIQRRLIKGMEDLMVSYDMTVRNNKNKIVQFRYGDDGIDTVKVENQSLPILTMSTQDIYAHYTLPDDASSKNKALSQIFLKNALTRYKKQMDLNNEKCSKYIQYMLDVRGEIIKHVFKNKSDTVVNCPVAFSYIITNIQGQQGINSNSLVDITPLEAFEMIEQVYSTLENGPYNKPTNLFKTLYYYYLSPKELLMVKRFNRAALTVLLQTIAVSYKRSIVTPGEMVGMTSGQSIGETSTQMTLNTFHFAGVSSKSNVTRGVPRIEEILSLSSEPKNPSMTVYLKQDEEAEREKAQTIMYMLEHTKLKEVVKMVEVCFDPDDLNTLISEDKTTMQQYREFESMIDECMGEDNLTNGSEKSKWVIRMELDPTVMLEKNITMDDINFALSNGYGEDISCVYSDYNSDKLVFRIRMNKLTSQSNKKAMQAKQVNSLDQSDQIYILKNFQEKLLENTILRGVKRLNKVILRKIKDNVVEMDGAYKKKDIWVLDTIGTNMMDVLALDYIDAYRTFSNDIVEMYETLGIEAARQSIYNEMVEVIEFDGTYINYHHFSVLCDRMTFTHKMISMFRHGINNDNIGPIAKASFEETPQMFIMAAKHSELDTFRGVSANVMCGQEGYYGTSSFQVILDVEEMLTLEETVKYENPDNEEEEIDKMFGTVDTGDEPCSTNKLVIQNNVVSIKTVDMGADDEYNPF